MDSLIWYTGIFRIKSGILESSQESRNPAKIPKDSKSRRRKFIVSAPRPVTRDHNYLLRASPRQGPKEMKIVVVYSELECCAVTTISLNVGSLVISLSFNQCFILQSSGIGL